MKILKRGTFLNHLLGVGVVFRNVTRIGYKAYRYSGIGIGMYRGVLALKKEGEES